MTSLITRRLSAICILAAMTLFAGKALADVAINEILYHPSNVAVQPGEDAEDLQFIELYNNGPTAVNLSGASFSSGVVYTFPAGTTLAAGEFAVVVRSTAFMTLRGPAIPVGTKVFQWTSGDLANGGELIQLVDATATLIDEVTFDDAGLWPAAADGAGSSLELINPAYDSSYPLSWRASSAVNGTPGARNGRYTEGPVVMLDAPARGSVIAALPTVSVTFAESVTGVVAGNLVVGGSAATSVVCSSCVGGAGAGPWVFSGFAVPTANPMTVTLSSGAIRDSQSNLFAGDTWLYFLSVPKIVINELHYNPASATDVEEFIELYNAETTAVDISGWKISEFGSPGCTFPAATVMPAGSYVVCAKDPVALATATGFTTTYSWGVSDSLSNGGEPVSLLNASGTIVDRIEYADAPPWPSGPGSPDGFGPSLELTNPGVDNAQGQFWKASVSANGTPGAVNSSYSNVPVVASEIPGRGSVIIGLSTVSVTFSKAVTGVTKDDLEVNDVAATAVTGSGVGPYVFTVANPGMGSVAVVLAGGGIADAGGTPFAGDSWRYYFGYPRIVINEVHYNPSSSAVAVGENAEDLQFIEFYNNEEIAVDLSGWAVAEGISFIFPEGTVMPAGGYLVLAANGLFLESKMDIPVGAQVFTWTSGDLANGGEKLLLSDAYGHEIDQVQYNDSGDWTDAADGKGPSLELINPGLANEGGGAWQASTATNGTPGAPNSASVVNPAPIIFGTLHSPALPQANQFVTITANVIDEDGQPDSVTLFYRQDQNPPIAYSSTLMFDDGLHGDGAADDGRYGAVVAGLDDGQQLDFYISASDGVGTAVAPAGHSTLNRFGYPSQTYLCAFSNEELPTDFPVYHILVTLNNKANQEAIWTYPARKEAFDATFIDGEGNIWYNITERFRGQSSLFKFPSSYRIDFPSNRKLNSPLGFPVESLQLNGMRPAAQWLGFNLFNRAGMPAPRVGWARVRYTGINYDTCCTGQNSYYGLHVVVERLDGDFLDSQNGNVVPPRSTSSEGNLYRGRNDGNLRWEGTDPNTYRTDVNGQSGYEKYNNETTDFWGDLISQCDAVSNTPAEQYVAHVKAHVDEDNWARYYALQMLMGNREGGIYLDTGDDYFIYMPPPGDPLNPAHPDFGTAQFPADRTTGRSQMIPWDTDSVLWGEDFSIWRTNVPAAQTFLRHNAFAPIFVKDLEDLAAGAFSPATMNAILDSMPDDAFGQAEGSDLWPETRQQYKNWIANRLPYVLNETVDDLTLVGGSSIIYSDPNPVIHLTGRLQQAGTHNITVNGSQATFSVYNATWSYDLALTSGVNSVLVQAWDRAGNEKDRVESQIFYNPPGPFQIHMAMRAPRRMVNDRTVTIEAAITDPIGRVSWNQWDEFGTVSVVRLPDRTPVAVTNTVFDATPSPEDSIHFMNGWGSVSFTLDDGAAFAPGEIEVSVSWHGLTASRNVTVLRSPVYRDMTGTLTGTNLVWGPDENIRVTGTVTVAAGSTLTIHPGTIVQVNTTGSLENGTLIIINGNLQALGTKDSPIFFFSERGASAMTLTQSGSASNGNAWRGFQFYGAGSSTMRQVILTGAGNGNVVSHPRPPILGLFNTHSLYTDRCVFADNNGMVFSGQGTGQYTIRKTLVNRAGIGAEFFGNGHTLRILDSWFTRVGHAPEAAGLDGDLLHVDGAASNQLIRGCIVNDGGDDGIDHSGSTFTVEHTIIHQVTDKAISMTGGHATVRNTLMFSNRSGIRGTASTEYVTINTASPIGAVDNVQTSIIWPASIPTCVGTVGYTDVGNQADLGCGTGNISVDPQFMDPNHNDYNPRPGSPALTAGPNQDRIGWLGFPYGSVCATTADCNDTNACTTDVCVDKLCTFTPVVGCMPCDINEDCDDSNQCTVDTCAVDGSCVNTAQVNGSVCSDGKACTSPDTCTDGVCAGPQNCPGGGQCDVSGACATLSGTIIFQNDLNGYTGTHDTYMHQASPSTTRGDDILLRWDSEDPAGIQIFSLLRFADMFGTGANQIPDGATITSATLTLFVEDLSLDPPAYINDALVSWDEATAAWNNFGGEAGVQADEYGTQAGFGPIDPGSFNLDVTASVQAWSASPVSNYGWVFRPNSWDGIRATSSEGVTQANRPKLTVTFERPVNGCSIDADCNDGLYCNGVETCNTLTMLCVSAAADVCDDSVPCTTDSCNETTDSCDHTATDILCDDGNLCTDDVCGLTAGCQHNNNVAPCSDDNACTDDDTCSQGVCTAGPALDCDDNVACTADSCDPLTGCLSADTCIGGLVCNLSNGLCETGPTEVTFRDGEGEYDGTVDTYLHAGMPDANNAMSATLMVDGPVPVADERQILLRFEDVFGSGPGQVPPGARIVSATLTMFVSNSSADGADLFRILVPWTDAMTWNQAVGGMQQDGLESMAASDAGGATNSNRVPYDMEVTASMIAWSGGQANLGWVFVMPVSGTDSWQFASSEEVEIEQRPKLTVSFIPCEPGYAGDGIDCFDVDECQEASSSCDANSTCTNTEGAYTCECLDGFKGDGYVCNECPGGAATVCNGRGTCTGDVDGAYCTCEDGFRGDACEQCLSGLWGANCDEMCAGGMANPCNDHGVCLDGVDGTGVCTCDERFAGDACQECAEGYDAYPDCTLNPECSDDNPCTTDSFDGVCVYDFNDMLCDDGNACTTDDHCSEGTCSDWSDVFCDDHNKCTDDSCDPVTGCVYAAIAGCCIADADCDDDDPCTTDVCHDQISICSNVQISGCGNADGVDDFDIIADVSTGDEGSDIQDTQISDFIAPSDSSTDDDVVAVRHGGCDSGVPGSAGSIVPLFLMFALIGLWGARRLRRSNREA